MRVWTRNSLTELIFKSDRTLVYRVCDVDAKESAIIKSMTEEHPTQDQLNKFYHEYELLKPLKQKNEGSFDPANAAGMILPQEQLIFDGRPSILFPDVGGASLAQLATNPMEMGIFFRTAISIVESLGRTHSLGIIHRDINPSNLLALSDFSKIWLIDFSIASKSKKEMQLLKPVQDLEGTLQYLAPEQSGRINRGLDYRADYYSLGLTFFELLTGRKPFQAADVMELLHAHMTQPIPDLLGLRRDLPRSLVRVIEKMTAKDPNDRYQSSWGLLSDLKKAKAAWTKKDLDTDFSLGANDFSEHFVIPEKIYGREVETEKLLQIYTEIQNQNSLGRLTLVCGHSGVGKSALVHQLYKPVAFKKGYLLEGKIDQFQQSSGLAGFKNGLLTFFDLLSGDSPQLLKEIREELTQTLRNNLGVLTSLFPELARYLGDCQPPQSIGPKETRDRLFESLEVLFKVICEKKSIVFFVDDLQWANALTFDFIEVLVQAKLPGFMLLGAYRANEVDEGHALVQLIKKLGEMVLVLELLPLKEQAIHQLLEDALGKARNLDLITQLMIRKTGGNPFFAHQLLKKLYVDEIMTLDPVNHAWQMNTDVLSSMQVSQNVMEFLLNKFKTLDGNTQDLLFSGAASGSRFLLKHVAGLMKQEHQELMASLQKAVDEEIIRPTAGNYQKLISGKHLDSDFEMEFQFLHDRLQQAAYELKDEKERKDLHFRLAELLAEPRLKSNLKNENENYPDKIADHYLKADLEGCEESVRAKIINRIVDAAAYTKKNAGFKRAFEYTQRAQTLCSAGEADSFWKKYPAVMRKLFKEAFELAMLNSEKEACDRLGHILLAHSNTALERGETYLLLGDQAFAAAEYEDSIDYCIQSLNQYGIQLKKKPSLIGLILSLIQVLRMANQWHKNAKGMKVILDYPPSSDPTWIQAVQALRVLSNSAVTSNSLTLVLSALIFAILSLPRRGLTSTTCNNLAFFSMVLFGLGKRDLAREVGEVAAQLISHPVSTDRIEASQAYLSWISGVGCHFLPPSELKIHYDNIIKESFEVKGFIGLCGVAWNIETLSPMRPLSMLQEFQSFLPRIQQVGNSLPILWFFIFSRFYESLTYRSESEEAGILTYYKDQIAESSQKNSLDAALARTYLGIHFLILGKTSEAYPFLLEAYNARNGLFGVSQPAAQFYYVLTLASRVRQEKRKPSLRERMQMRQVVGYLKKMSQFSPDNYHHYHHLAQAEYAAAHKRPEGEVTGLFQKAIESAEKSGNYLLRALSHERTADYYRSLGNLQVGGFYLFKAYEIYKAWEAWAKVMQLERCYPEIFESSKAKSLEGRNTSSSFHTSSTRVTQSTGEAASKNLDLAEILKAARSLSSEVVLANLTKTLLKIVAEVSGAERGVLLLPEKDGKLAPYSQFDHKAKADKGNLPTTLIDRIATKTEAIIFVDAASDERLANDPYFRGRRVRSVLGLPIMNQGNLRAALYLENREIAGVFTEERMNTLDVIGSQAAISIENAKLYETLEEKVIERTEQLNAKNRDIQTMLRHLHQGIFTLTPDLTIHPEYSSYLEVILGETQLAGKDPLELLLDRSDFGSNEQDQIKGALAASLEGTVIDFEVNRHLLPSHLTRKGAYGGEKGDQFLELDWQPILDGKMNIGKILVTLRDVTDLKHLEAQAQEQKVELQMIGELLACGVDRFRSYHENSIRYLEENMGLISNGKNSNDIPPKIFDQVFRNLHTVKGNTRTLNLSLAVDALHEAEQYLDLIRKEGAELDFARLESDLVKSQAALERYAHIAGTQLAGVTQVKQAPLLGSLGASRLKYPRAITLAEMLEAELESLGEIAASLGKGVPEVEIRDQDESGEPCLFSSQHAAVLKDVLSHCLRNALDHGLEMGKAGKIQIVIGPTPSSDPNLCELRFSDNGRGLDIGVLRAKGKKSGACQETWSDTEVAELVFRSGITTAEKVTAISGRGVGMDAVRALLVKSGGKIRIEFTGPKSEAGFQPFQWVLSIPSPWVYRKISTARESLRLVA